MKRSADHKNQNTNKSLGALFYKKVAWKSNLYYDSNNKENLKNK
jgi:hypothetical protein